jgi:hypothetical protein
MQVSKIRLDSNGRKSGTRILTETMERRQEIGFNSYDLLPVLATGAQLIQCLAASNVVRVQP